MTVRTPPTFLQAGSHTAENTRLLTHGLLQSTPSSFAGGVAAADPAHGVARIGDLTVSQNGTPNMSVNVASGGCFIRGTQSAAQGVYHVFNDATVNLSIDTADATNPRRDLIVMQVRDSGYAGANDDARLLVVKGTAAASPVDPTPPADCLVLARISVAANATSIVTASITDLRTYAYGRSLLPKFASTTERDSYLPSPSAGMACYVDSNDASEGLYANSGSGWASVSMPIGSLISYIGSTAPNSSWLVCDGAAVSRTTYATLFSIISTTYGAGNGSTTFNLPDMRGRAPIGSGTGTGLTSRSLGANGGAETHTLTTTEIPSHTHTVARADPNVASDVLASNFRTLNTSNGTVATGATGGGGSHNNMQPFVVVNFIIKAL